MATRSLLLLATLTVIAPACHRKPPPVSTPPVGQPQTAEPSQPLAGEVNPAMTRQLQIFVQIAGRLPTNFTELARTRLDLVPRTPPGMKWAIDPATSEVKLVKE